jgi:hypothetical protein
MITVNPHGALQQDLLSSGVVSYDGGMPKKLQEEERLTEMLTVVTNPVTRAHLDDVAVRRETKLGYIVRQAIKEWLETNDPLDQETLVRLTTAYLAQKGHRS